MLARDLLLKTAAERGTLEMPPDGALIHRGTRDVGGTSVRVLMIHS